MANLFIVRLSEDGVSERIFTNVKVLYKEFSNVSSYKGITIGYGCEDDKAFSYNNLVKAVKENHNVNVMCEGGSNIEIIRAYLVKH